MITNELGDKLIMDTCEMRVKDATDLSKGYRLRMVTKAIDSRDGKTTRLVGGKSVDVDNAIADGVITEQEYGQVFELFKRLFEWSNSTKKEENAKEEGDEAVSEVV